MAEHILETRIQLRYASYAQWMNSNLILKQGEAAVCTFPQNRTIEAMSNSQPENTPPAIGIKIGDGVHYFSELPWIQAVAADVYNWAKSSYKPTYTAQEIQGLQSYVENLVGGDVNVTIAPRIYQLVQGTGDNQYKYYLRYKENNEQSQWVVDTSTYIDLEDLTTLVEWIGRTDLEDYANLSMRIGSQTRTMINRLNYTDTPRNNYFVTEVNETNGIIDVVRAQPTFSNISGTLGVSQGGTGRTTLTEDYVLVGDGANAVKLIPIAESIESNNHLVPNYLIKAYVDNATQGITGAMHFIGEASVVINENSSVDPRINDYNFSAARPGDVILYGTKEFVWTGAKWHLLGDEGSYAIKGSIRDVDIDAEANIQQSKISGLTAALAGKVNIVSGKDLSTNDFSNEYKDKLEDIEANAQRNVIEHIFVNGTMAPVTTVQDYTKSVNIEFNEFTTEEKTKLSLIQAGAQVNSIESIIINGTTYRPTQDKTITITLDSTALNLNAIEGAEYPISSSQKEDVTVTNKKLQLAAIAATGNIADLLQTSDTYILINCGNSTSVI